MQSIKIDIYSSDYEKLLQIDSEDHSTRTGKLDFRRLTWTYDPINCNLADFWAYDIILGNELRRYNSIIFNRIGKRA